MGHFKKENVIDMKSLNWIRVDSFNFYNSVELITIEKALTLIIAKYRPSLLQNDQEFNITQYISLLLSVATVM